MRVSHSLILVAQVFAHRMRMETAPSAGALAVSVADTPCTGDQWPRVCPGTLPRPDTQTWQMNRSTIIMPCNNTGLTDPRTVANWAITDWDVRPRAPLPSKTRPSTPRSPFHPSLPKTRSSTPRSLFPHPNSGPTTRAPAPPTAGRSTSPWTTRSCCSSRCR